MPRRSTALLPLLIGLASLALRVLPSDAAGETLKDALEDAYDDLPHISSKARDEHGNEVAFQEHQHVPRKLSVERISRGELRRLNSRGLKMHEVHELHFKPLFESMLQEIQSQMPTRAGDVGERGHDRGAKTSVKASQDDAAPTVSARVARRKSRWGSRPRGELAPKPEAPLLLLEAGGGGRGWGDSEDCFESVRLAHPGKFKVVGKAKDEKVEVACQGHDGKTIKFQVFCKTAPCKDQDFCFARDPGTFKSWQKIEVDVDAQCQDWQDCVDKVQKVYGQKLEVLPGGKSTVERVDLACAGRAQNRAMQFTAICGREPCRSNEEFCFARDPGPLSKWQRIDVDVNLQCQDCSSKLPAELRTKLIVKPHRSHFHADVVCESERNNPKKEAEVFCSHEPCQQQEYCLVRKIKGKWTPFDVKSECKGCVDSVRKDYEGIFKASHREGNVVNVVCLNDRTRQYIVSCDPEHCKGGGDLSSCFVEKGTFGGYNRIKTPSEPCKTCVDRMISKYSKLLMRGSLKAPRKKPQYVACRGNPGRQFQVLCDKTCDNKGEPCFVKQKVPFWIKRYEELKVDIEHECRETREISQELMEFNMNYVKKEGSPEKLIAACNVDATVQFQVLMQNCPGKARWCWATEEQKSEAKTRCTRPPRREFLLNDVAILRVPNSLNKGLSSNTYGLVSAVTATADENTVQFTVGEEKFTLKVEHARRFWRLAEPDKQFMREGRQSIGGQTWKEACIERRGADDEDFRRWCEDFRNGIQLLFRPGDIVWREPIKGEGWQAPEEDRKGKGKEYYGLVVDANEAPIGMRYTLRPLDSNILFAISQERVRYDRKTDIFAGGMAMSELFLELGKDHRHIKVSPTGAFSLQDKSADDNSHLQMLHKQELSSHTQDCGKPEEVVSDDEDVQMDAQKFRERKCQAADKFEDRLALFKTAFNGLPTSTDASVDARSGVHWLVFPDGTMGWKTPGAAGKYLDITFNPSDDVDKFDFNLTVHAQGLETIPSEIAPRKKLLPTDIATSMCLLMNIDLMPIASVPGNIIIGLEGQISYMPPSRCWGWQSMVMLQFAIGVSIGGVDLKIGVVLAGTLTMTEVPLGMAKKDLSIVHVPQAWDISKCQSRSPFALFRPMLKTIWGRLKGQFLGVSSAEGSVERVKKAIQEEQAKFLAFDQYENFLRKPGERASGHWALRVAWQASPPGGGQAKKVIITPTFQNSLPKEEAPVARLFVWQDLGHVLYTDSKALNRNSDEESFVFHLDPSRKIACRLELLSHEGGKLITGAQLLELEPGRDGQEHIRLLVQVPRARSHVVSIQKIDLGLDSAGCRGHEINRVEVRVRTGNSWEEPEYESATFGNKALDAARWAVRIEEGKKASDFDPVAIEGFAGRPHLKLSDMSQEKFDGLIHLAQSASKSEAWADAIDKMRQELEDTCTSPSGAAVRVVRAEWLLDFLMEVLESARNRLAAGDVDVSKGLQRLISEMAPRIPASVTETCEKTLDKCSKREVFDTSVQPKEESPSWFWKTHSEVEVKKSACSLFDEVVSLDGKELDAKTCFAGGEISMRERNESLGEGPPTSFTKYDVIQWHDCSPNPHHCMKSRCLYWLCASRDDAVTDPGSNSGSTVWMRTWGYKTIDKVSVEGPVAVAFAPAWFQARLLKDFGEETLRGILAEMAGQFKKPWAKIVGNRLQPVRGRGNTWHFPQHLVQSCLSDFIVRHLSPALFKDSSWIDPGALSKAAANKVQEDAGSAASTAGLESDARIKVHLRDSFTWFSAYDSHNHVDQYMGDKELDAVRRWVEVVEVETHMADKAPCKAKVALHMVLQPPKERPYPRPALIPVAQAFFVASSQFVGKLPFYADQVLGHLNQENKSARSKVNAAFYGNSRYKATNGRYLHRHLKMKERGEVKVSEGDMGEWDWVYNYPKVFELSENREQPWFWYAAGVSVANLFIRALGDIQALFNLHFAEHPDWDGKCHSLPPKFHLLYEWPASGKGQPWTLHSNWRSDRGRTYSVYGGSDADPTRDRPAYRAGELVSEKGQAMTQDDRSLILDWHWISRAFDVDARSRRSRFFRMTPATRGNGAWGTIDPSQQSAVMWPHIWCETIKQHHQLDDQGMIESSLREGDRRMLEEMDDFLVKGESPDASAGLFEEAVSMFDAGTQVDIFQGFVAQDDPICRALLEAEAANASARTRMRATAVFGKTPADCLKVYHLTKTLEEAKNKLQVPIWECGGGDVAAKLAELGDRRRAAEPLDARLRLNNYLRKVIDYLRARADRMKDEASFVVGDRVETVAPQDESKTRTAAWLRRAASKSQKGPRNEEDEFIHDEDELTEEASSSLLQGGAEAQVAAGIPEDGNSFFHALRCSAFFGTGRYERGTLWQASAAALRKSFAAWLLLQPEPDVQRINELRQDKAYISKTDVQAAADMWGVTIFLGQEEFKARNAKGTVRLKHIAKGGDEYFIPEQKSAEEGLDCQLRTPVGRVGLVKQARDDGTFDVDFQKGEGSWQLTRDELSKVEDTDDPVGKKEEASEDKDEKSPGKLTKRLDVIERTLGGLSGVQEDDGHEMGHHHDTEEGSAAKVSSGPKFEQFSGVLTELKNLIEKNEQGTAAWAAALGKYDRQEIELESLMQGEIKATNDMMDSLVEALEIVQAHPALTASVREVRQLARGLNRLAWRNVIEAKELTNCVEELDRPPEKKAEAFRPWLDPKPGDTWRDRLHALKSLEPGTVDTTEFDDVEFYFQDACRVPFEHDFRKGAKFEDFQGEQERPECERVLVNKAFTTMYPSLLGRARRTFQDLNEDLTQVLNISAGPGQVGAMRAEVLKMIERLKAFLMALTKDMHEDFYWAFGYQSDNLFGDLWRSVDAATIRIVNTIEDRKQERLASVTKHVAAADYLKKHRIMRVQTKISEEKAKKKVYGIPVTGKDQEVANCFCKKAWKIWTQSWLEGPRVSHFRGCVEPRYLEDSTLGMKYEVEVGATKYRRRDWITWTGLCKTESKPLEKCRSPWATCDPRAQQVDSVGYEVYRHADVLQDHPLSLPLVSIQMAVHVDTRSKASNACSLSGGPIMFAADFSWTMQSWNSFDTAFSACVLVKVSPVGMSIGIVYCHKMGKDPVTGKYTLSRKEFSVTGALSLLDVLGTDQGNSMTTSFRGVSLNSYMRAWSKRGFGMYAQGIGVAKEWVNTSALAHSSIAWYFDVVAEIMVVVMMSRWMKIAGEGSAGTENWKTMLTGGVSQIWRVLIQYGVVPRGWKLRAHPADIAKLNEWASQSLAVLKTSTSASMTFAWKRETRQQKRPVQEMIEDFSIRQLYQISKELKEAVEPGVFASELQKHLQERSAHGALLRGPALTPIVPELRVNFLRKFITECIARRAEFGKPELHDFLTEVFGMCGGRPTWYKILRKNVYPCSQTRQNYFLKTGSMVGRKVLLWPMQEGWLQEALPPGEGSRFYSTEYILRGHMEKVAWATKSKIFIEGAKYELLKEDQILSIVDRALPKDVTCWSRMLLEMGGEKAVEIFYNLARKPMEDKGLGLDDELQDVTAGNWSTLPLRTFSKSVLMDFIIKNWEFFLKEMEARSKKKLWLERTFYRGEGSVFKINTGGLGAEEHAKVKTAWSIGLNTVYKLSAKITAIPVVQVAPSIGFTVRFNVLDIIRSLMALVRTLSKKNPTAVHRARMELCRRCVGVGMAFCDQQYVASQMLSSGWVESMDQCVEKTAENAQKCRQFTVAPDLDFELKAHKLGKAYYKEMVVEGKHNRSKEEIDICPCYDLNTNGVIAPEWITTMEHCQDMRWPGQFEPMRLASKSDDWLSGLAQIEFEEQRYQMEEQNLQADYNQRLSQRNELIYRCQTGYRCCAAESPIHDGRDVFACVHKSSTRSVLSLGMSRCSAFKIPGDEDFKWSGAQDQQCGYLPGDLEVDGGARAAADDEDFDAPSNVVEQEDTFKPFLGFWKIVDKVWTRVNPTEDKGRAAPTGEVEEEVVDK